MSNNDYSSNTDVNNINNDNDDNLRSWMALDIFLHLTWAYLGNGLFIRSCNLPHTEVRDQYMKDLSVP